MAGKAFSGAPFSREQFKDVPLAGHTFAYESGGVRITFADVRKRAVQAGFSQDLVDNLMPDITKERAWRRARKAFAGRRNGYKVDISPAARTTDYIKHQVTFKEVDETKGREKVLFTDTFMCIFYKKDEKLVFDGVGNNAAKKLVSTALRDLYEELCKVINTSTVRHFCQKVSERYWSPVPIKKHGGVWFGLKEHTGEMEKMEKFFDSLGGDYAFYMMPVVDTSKDRRNISKWVEYGMETDMSALQGEFERKMEESRTATGDKKGKVSLRAMQGFVTRARSFVGKVGVYETALNYKAQDLREKAGDVEDMVKQAIAGKVKGVKVEEPAGKNGKAKTEKAPAKKPVKKVVVKKPIKKPAKKAVKREAAATPF